MRGRFLITATVAACVLIFVAWQQFFYEPIQREILSVQLETRRLRELKRELVELKARHGDLSTLATTKELALDEARNFLPATVAQDKFIDELYQAAQMCDARLLAVQAGEIISAKEISAQVVNVKLEASYVALLNFIRAILDGGRLVSLGNFSAEVSSGNLLSCELSFKIFAAP